MPLSRDRMRERKQMDRGNVKPKSNLSSVSDVKPSNASPVKPGTDGVGGVGSSKPNIEGLRALIRNIERGSESLCTPSVQPSVPIYNPALHKAGDKVLVKRGSRFIEAVIPKLDAEGRSIPDYE